MDLIVPLQALRLGDAPVLGVKAACLGELIGAGFAVPPGFVLSPEARQSCPDGVVSADLVAMLATAYTKLGRRRGEQDPRVAVRSSVAGEDGGLLSFAGVYTSVTNVRGVTAIGCAIEQCWASASGERARGYRALNGAPAPPSMAVIVQAMVPATRGGVAFSVDPTGRDADVAIIEASYGHTEAVVSGLVEPDTYVVSRRTGRMIGVRLGTKAEEIVPDRQGEVHVTVPVTRRRRRALESAQVVEVARLALAVERHLGRPQDIEWCFADDGALFLLQARPVPARSPHARRGQPDGAVMAMGAGASPGVGTGPARVLATVDEARDLPPGAVLVVSSPSPDWLPVLDRIAAVVTDRGGITGHLAIACRELGLPCVVGARTATVDIRTGDVVTVDGTAGVARSATADAVAAVVKR